MHAVEHGNTPGFRLHSCAHRLGNRLGTEAGTVLGAAAGGVVEVGVGLAVLMKLSGGHGR